MSDALFLQTMTGRRVYPACIESDDINITDIAHALSQICRFGGHSRVFYSVAQHSVHVARMVPEQYAFGALLHDATEAYLGDIPRPLKLLPCFDEYREIEADLMETIRKRFNVKHALDIEPIKAADRRALATEARDVIDNAAPGFWKGVSADPTAIVAQSPQYAFGEFMRLFDALSQSRHQTSLF